MSIKPSKKYPQAHGSIQFKCWVSHYSFHNQGSTLSLSKGSTLSLSKVSTNSSLSSRRASKKVRIEETPRVTIIQPKEARSGDVVTVRGRHFGSPEDIESIKIGDQICPLFTAESPSLIQLTIPYDLAPGKTEIIITTHSAGKGVCLATLTIQESCVIPQINACSEEINYDEIENFELNMPGNIVHTNNVQDPSQNETKTEVSPPKETGQMASDIKSNPATVSDIECETIVDSNIGNLNPFLFPNVVSDGETSKQESLSLDKKIPIPQSIQPNNSQGSMEECNRLEAELSRVNGEYEEYRIEFGGEMEMRIAQIVALKTENNKLRDQVESMSEKYGKLLADVMTECPALLEY